MPKRNSHLYSMCVLAAVFWKISTPLLCGIVSSTFFIIFLYFPQFWNSPHPSDVGAPKFLTFTQFPFYGVNAPNLKWHGWWQTSISGLDLSSDLLTHLLLESKCSPFETKVIHSHVCPFPCYCLLLPALSSVPISSCLGLKPEFFP